MDNQIFISHRHDDVDSDALESLAEDLDAVFSTFQHMRDGLGGRWDDDLVARLDQAPLVLVVVGPTWFDDPRLPDPEDAVHREVLYALEHEIALPVYVRRPVATAAELAVVPELAGLLDWQGVVVERMAKDLPALMRQIARRLQENAHLARPALRLGAAARAADGRVRSRAPSRARPQPSWSRPADGVVGVLAGPAGPVAVVLQPDALVTQGPDGREVSSVALPGAESAALTSDGRWAVVGTGDGIALVDASSRLLRSAGVSRGAAGERVVGCWLDGEIVVAALRSDSGVGLVRLDPDGGRARPWGLARPDGGEPRARVAGHASGWATVGAEGRVTGAGDVLEVLLRVGPDGWVDVDLGHVSPASSGAGALLGAVRTDGRAGSVLVVARCVGGEWTEAERFPVRRTDHVQVSRAAGSVEEEALVLDVGGTLEGWTLAQLRARHPARL